MTLGTLRTIDKEGVYSMYSHPQFTGAVPVHNVDGMFGVLVVLRSVNVGVGECSLEGLPGLVGDSRRVIQAFPDHKGPQTPAGSQRPPVTLQTRLNGMSHPVAAGHSWQLRGGL